jgi:flagellar hook-associated protein 3 FlgL
MRVSSSTYQLQWLSALRRQQAELSAIQQQVSSGKRISTAADDPAGAAQGLLLQQGLDRLQNYAGNAQTASRRLGLEEDSLSQATDALNRIRELAIQAANGTQTQESRTAIAAEAAELLTGLISTANAQDGEGRYLFAGNAVQTRPFTTSPSVTYAGDTGTRVQRVADGRTVQENDPGSAVFVQIPTGNGSYTVSAGAGNQGTASWSSATVSDPPTFVPGAYTVTLTADPSPPPLPALPDPPTWVASNGAIVTGNLTSITTQGATITLDGTPAIGDTFTVDSSRYQDVFKTVQDFINTLGQTTGSASGRTAFQNQLNSNLQNIDQALQHLTNFRSQVGARLATIDQQTESNADVKLELTSSLSSIRDLDYATAISQLELRLTSLEAAQKAYARTQSFSLFDVL